jgi:DinB superfamily
MKKETSPEVWLRGPVPGIPALLQPVAHALLQAREEASQLMEGFPKDRLWERPWNTASPGFHLRHLSGVLDRMFTYARGEALTEEQFKSLNTEFSERSPETETAPSGHFFESPDQCSGQDLSLQFAAQVDRALRQLGATSEKSLLEPREVGRAKLPSTVLGLLVHAAEHTQRHIGQLLVTTRILRSQS